MPEPVILAAVRTPFGKRGGAFRDHRPDALLAHALRGLVARAGVPAERVEDVICGTVTQAASRVPTSGGSGPARGFPVTVPAVSLNRMCGSSQQAVHFAAQAIAAGDARYAIGCGVENMTRVRMFSDIDPDGRHGGFGGLNPNSSGSTRSSTRARAPSASPRSGGSRAQRWTNSRPRATPAPGRRSRGEPTARSTRPGRGRGGRRDRTHPRRGRPRAHRFGQDGDAQDRVPRERRDHRRELEPDLRRGVRRARRRPRDRAGGRPKARARFLARVVVGSDPTLQLDGVIPATRLALERAKLAVKDVDWFEVNEAFACVALAWAREFAPAPRSSTRGAERSRTGTRWARPAAG